MPPRVAWLVAAFLVTRLAVLAIYSPEIDRGDQTQYVRVASSVLEHGLSGYLDPPYRIQRGDYFPYFRGEPENPDGLYNPIFWDPLYPAFVSVVFWLFGVSTDAVRWVQIALSLATMFLGMHVVRRIFPGEPRAPTLFGWLFVAYLPLAGFATRILAETLDAFMLVALLACAIRLGPRKLAVFFGFGLLLGLYASIKSYFLQLMPLIVALLGWSLWVAGDRAAQRRLCAGLALVVVGFAAALAPTLVRNHTLVGAAVLSTKGPWNFWKDNNNFQIVSHDWRQPNVKVHQWLEHYHALGSSEAVPLILPNVYEDPTQAIRPPCDLPLPEFESCERNNAIRFILEDPLRFARRAVVKVANLWSPNDYIFNRAPAGQLAWHQNYRIDLPGWLRWVLQLEVMGLYIALMLAFFAALAAPVQSERDRLARTLVVLWLLFLTAVVVPVGHGVSRFRLPFMVPVAMFAALGIARGRSGLARLWGRDAVSLAVRVPLALAFAGWAAIVAFKLPLLLAP